MKDFEVHPRGTAEEIKLSRALAKEIEQISRTTTGNEQHRIGVSTIVRFNETGP